MRPRPHTQGADAYSAYLFVIFAAEAARMRAAVGRAMRRAVGMLFAVGRVFAPLYKQHVFAHFCHVAHGHELLFAAEGEFAARNHKAFYLIFGIVEQNVAHPAEVFAVAKAHYLQFFDCAV